MGVRLSKGQKVDLTKTNPGLQVVMAGLGWDVSHNQSQYDLDASAFLTGASGKVQSDSDFVFYNNPSGGNGSILYSSDNRTGAGTGDDEQIRIELNKVPQHIHRIAFTITIHDAQMKGQNFGQVSNAYVRIFNAMTNEELLRFDLGRDFTVETAIVAAELYRHNGEWKFNAIASGFQGGLAALCRNFGVSVDDEPVPSQQPSFGHGQFQQQANYGQQSHGFSPQQSQQTQSGYSPSSFGQPAYNQTTYSTPPSQPSAMGGQTGFGQPVQAQSYTDGNIACTRCGSTNIRTGQKGFGLGKAAIGGLILGPVGLLGGFIGKNQLKLTCNACGNSWSPNQTDYAQWANDQKRRAQELFTRFKSQDVLDAIVAS